MTAAVALMMTTGLLFQRPVDKKQLERTESLKMICCPHDNTHPPKSTTDIVVSIRHEISLTDQYLVTIHTVCDEIHHERTMFHFRIICEAGAQLHTF